MAISGLRELYVDQDDITVTKLLFIKTHWKISEIDHCAGVMGELHVYVKGRRRVAFIVDTMFDNYNTFVYRMNKEQIPIS